MPSYSTPGVYIEEVPVFPPSIAPVATAIPAFIGATQKIVGKNGEDLTTMATRITSLLEYEAIYGAGPPKAVTITVERHLTADDVFKEYKLGWDSKQPDVPDWFLYPSLQLYFANGGGPCYIRSIGDYAANPAKKAYTDAIAALEAEDEPTLLVFPDALKLNDADYGAVVDAALTSCNKMQDRFTLADVRNAVPGGTDTGTKVGANFRSNVKKGTVEFAKYGAAYFPYILTNVPFMTGDAQVTVKTYHNVKPKPNGDLEKTAVDAKKGKLSELKFKEEESALYSQVRAFVDSALMILPPSGAIAGIYAQVDRTRGVWKAPANVGLSLAIGPAVSITNDLQDGLNIDPETGKSVNVVRSFFGKGTMVWGARTLAGNDNEWKYVNVRRFANFVEESVKKAINAFVFEPNDANTWVKVRTMIENFLTNQWRDGALMGAKAEQAFRVAVGLGQTMSPDDVLNGYMIVEVHLAIVRPAEFIVLRFMQKMPEA